MMNKKFFSEQVIKTEYTSLNYVSGKFSENYFGEGLQNFFLLYY